MKRIAMISEHASPLALLGSVDSGGQNVYVGKLAEALGRLGYQIDIFTRADAPDLPEVVILSGKVRVIHVTAGPKTFVPKEKLLPYMKDFFEAVLSFVDRDGITYDLVHAHFFMSAWVAMQLKALLKIPYVVTFHALGKVRNYYQNGADAFPPERIVIEQRVVQDADMLIAECRQDVKDLVKHYNASLDRVVTIPCGFDPDEFYPLPQLLAKQQVKLNPYRSYVLQLGRMVPRKGVDTVIEGFAEYLRLPDSRSDVDLLIVGGESDTPDPTLTPEIGRLQSLTGTLGITDRVIFIGKRQRSALKFYYNAAEVFVTTPWYEPFGITPLEAMACGVPVIGAKVGGIASTVRHTKTGILVPPRQAHKVAQALRTLLHNPSLLQMYKAAALQRVQKRYTWNRVALQVDEVYALLMYPALTPFIHKLTKRTTKSMLPKASFLSKKDYL